MSSIKLIALWAIMLFALGGATFYFTRPQKEVVCDCERCRVILSGGISESDTTLAIGSKLPDIQGNWVLSGKPKPEFAGHVTLIDFWGVTCLPCRLAIPNNNKIFAEYTQEGLMFAGVSIDPVATLIDYKESVRMDYPLLSASMSNFETFGVQFTPMAFLFDKQGKLVWKGSQMEKKDGTAVEAFQNALKSALTAPDVAISAPGKK